MAWYQESSARLDDRASAEQGDRCLSTFEPPPSPIHLLRTLSRSHHR